MTTHSHVHTDTQHNTHCFNGHFPGELVYIQLLLILFFHQFQKEPLWWLVHVLYRPGAWFTKKYLRKNPKFSVKFSSVYVTFILSNKVKIVIDFFM